jgi:MFS family permease
MSMRAIDEENETPVPYFRIMILGAVLWANNCSIWIIFTMLPFMVIHYFPTLSARELGYRAGYLGSAFHIGALLGNFAWGIASDRIGRKPALIGGLFGTAIAASMFGFAPTYWVAVLARFLWGFLNGNVGVSKTYIAEITDDTNSDKAMALYGTLGGFGRTIGPVLGGFLIHPATSYPATFRGTIFETYPFALPMLVMVCICIITIVSAIYFLPETLKGSMCYDEAWLLGEKSSSTSSLRRGRGRKGSREMMAISTSSNETMTKNTPVKKGISSLFTNSAINTQNTKYSHLSTNEDDNEEEEDVLFNVGDDRDNNGASSPLHSDAHSNNSNNNGKKKRKSVGFASVVMVKTIGSNSMGFGTLKKVTHEDVPLNHASEGGTLNMSHDREDDEENGMDREVHIDVEGGTDYTMGVDDGDEHGTLEEGEEMSELTPVKGFGLGYTAKDRASPPTRDESNTWRGSGRGGLVYSNGSEFYASLEETRKNTNGCWAYLSMISYLLSRRQVLLATSLYGFRGFITIMQSEIFPLWVVTSKSDGGFEYDSKMIGLASFITGPPLILGQLILYPRLVKEHGLLKTFKLASLIYAITALLTPCISWTNSLDNRYFTFGLVVISLTILGITGMWQFIAIFSFITNSCYSYQRATTNSIGQTFAAIGRLLAPYLGGQLFAWSETNGLSWPLNYTATFYLIAILSYVTGNLAMSFPRSIQRRKREPKRLRYTENDSHSFDEYDEYDDDDDMNTKKTREEMDGLMEHDNRSSEVIQGGDTVPGSASQGKNADAGGNRVDIVVDSMERDVNNDHNNDNNDNNNDKDGVHLRSDIKCDVDQQGAFEMKVMLPTHEEKEAL